MSFGAFNKRSQSSSVANTSHQGTQQSEVYGSAGSINGNNNTLNMLDGGAIDGAFKFASAHDARQMDVLDQLVKTGGSMFEAAASQTDQAANQQKMILYVAGAFVLVFGLQAFSK